MHDREKESFTLRIKAFLSLPLKQLSKRQQFVKSLLTKVSTVKIDQGVRCYPLAELSESARLCVTTPYSLFTELLCLVRPHVA